MTKSVTKRRSRNKTIIQSEKNRRGTGEETQKNLILKNKLTAADLLMNVNAAVNLTTSMNLRKPEIKLTLCGEKAVRKR